MNAPWIYSSRSFRRAFTLIEVLVASTICAIILLAAQSAIMLASHSVPGARSKATALTAGSGALDLLASDLSFATAVTSRTATQVTFQVPDRTGDGLPETIVWSWNGIAGAPLQCQINSGSVQTIVPSVQSFALAYDIRSTVAPTTYTTSAETLLSTYNSASLANDHRINNSQTVGQYFKPVLASNATAWSVTRVQLMTRKHGPANGQAYIQLASVNVGGLPSGNIVDQAILNESATGSSYAWQTFTYSAATGLDPTVGLAILVKWVSDADACDIQTATVSTALANGNMLSSTTGATWSASLLEDANYYVYGTVTAPDPPASLYSLTGVRALINTTNDAQATSRCSIRVLNEPQVGGP